MSRHNKPAALTKDYVLSAIEGQPLAALAAKGFIPEVPAFVGEDTPFSELRAIARGDDPLDEDELKCLFEDEESAIDRYFRDEVGVGDWIGLAEHLEDCGEEFSATGVAVATVCAARKHYAVAAIAAIRVE